VQLCDIVQVMTDKRKRAASRKGMRVTTVALPEAMHLALAKVALDRRTVMTELVRQAVSEWLQRNKGKAGRQEGPR